MALDPATNSPQSQYALRFERLASVPTAPFREEWLIDEVDRQLATMPGVNVQVDRFGNRIARLRRGKPRGLPVTFLAHMDHPGFIFDGDTVDVSGRVEPSTGRHIVEAWFEGRVETSYFRGSHVRLFRSADDVGIRAEVLEAEEADPKRDARRIVLACDGDPAGARLGMWDLRPFRRAEGLLHSRACDDLGGCAVMLEALARLAQPDESDLDITMLFTRAEEAGFCGLLCLINEEEYPSLLAPEGFFVSIETSGETALVQRGGGAIIRIGDRSSTFDGQLSDRFWSLAVAGGISARRALMDRGTCEATPLAREGFRAGGICIPVGNYHNMDQEQGVIAPECVSEADAESLVSLVTGLGRMLGRGEEAPNPIRHDYSVYLCKGRDRLAGQTAAARPAVG
jgi:putative aminopeptidase FrvX